tara:strand:+ start:3582 stop:3965 length:384 start_codon:yes stop_codon:yes gene_type:complete
MKATIFTLFSLATQIKYTSIIGQAAIEEKHYLNQIKFKELHYNKLPYSNAVSGVCKIQLIILACSYLDEYEQQLTPIKHPEHIDSILSFKKVTKPAIDRIKKWKDLKKYRNQITAHNYRIKGKSIFF